MSAYTPLHPRNFAGEVDGKPVRLITLQNSRGMTVRFTTHGAKVLQIIVPDRNGDMDDVALGYETLAGVLGGLLSIGAFVGRYAAPQLKSPGGRGISAAAQPSDDWEEF